MTTTPTTTKQPNALTVKAKGIGEFLMSRRDQIAQALPKHITAERLIRVAFTALTQTPQLLQCNQTSIFQAIMQSARLGLEPNGPLGEAYLIPYNDKKLGLQAQFMIGYKGLCNLAYRNDRIAAIDARCVFQGEAFEYDPMNGRISHPHSWNVERTEKNLLGAYGIAYLKGLDRPIVEILDAREIEKRRNRSKVPNGPAWKSDYLAMARKTALRALLTGGRVPLSVEEQRAIVQHGEEEPIEKVLRPSFTVEVGDVGGGAGGVDAPIDFSTLPDIDGPDDMAVDDSAREPGGDG